MPRPLHPSTRGRAAAAFLPVALALGLGGLIAWPNLPWYDLLHRPSFRPPDWFAAPVSGMLALGFGWAFYRVLAGPSWMPDRPGAIRAFAIEVLLAALWPFAFFGAHSPKLGLAVVLAQLVMAVVCSRRFGQVDRAAGWWTMPFGLWIAFWGLIGLSIAIRN